MSGEVSTSEDLSHDIFLKVFVNLSSFKERSKFSTWIYRITHNFCIDFLKKRNKGSTVNLGEFPDVLIENEEENERKIFQLKAENLVAVLNEIDPEDKAILLMKYQDESSIADISEVLEIGESAAKMRIKRAKAKAVVIMNNLYKNAEN